MAGSGAEALQRALVSLRARLREGVFRPGERLAAIEIGEDLRLSATPVREALSRLAGEGLLDDRPGQGFFVPVLTAPDVADLYRLNLALLSIALDKRRRRATLPGSEAVARRVEDPLWATDALFDAWIREGGGQVLLGRYRSLRVQLGPVRRGEAAVLADLVEEAEALAEEPAAPEGRLRLMRRFHARRIAAAAELAARLASSNGEY